MTQSTRPYRSVLYIPGSNARALDKARGLAADAIIFDLEDAVAPDEKATARKTVLEEIEKGGYADRCTLVRINSFETEWGKDDIEALRGAALDAILLPKVESAWDIETLAEIVPDVRIWAMMETAQGVLNAKEIAAHPRLSGMVMGTNDLARELGCRVGEDRAELMVALQHCLIAARADGIAIVDGVYNAFKDEDGLAGECRQGRDLGFDGKTLIHPAQIETANKIFAPSADDLALAKRQIDAHEAAEAAGKGVAVLDGKIVENLHVVTARALIAKAEAIAAMEG